MKIRKISIEQIARCVKILAQFLFVLFLISLPFVEILVEKITSSGVDITYNVKKNSTLPELIVTFNRLQDDVRLMKKDLRILVALKKIVTPFIVLVLVNIASLLLDIIVAIKADKRPVKAALPEGVDTDSIERRLSALVSVIAEETEKNESYRVNVERALGINASPGMPQPREEETEKQRKGIRTPAVLDPIEFARQGEGVLREKISMLTLAQLRDIVAQYGMDPDNLVMKWKDINRIKDRIVELALARATKDDVFRDN